MLYEISKRQVKEPEQQAKSPKKELDSNKRDVLEREALRHVDLERLQFKGGCKPERAP